MEDKNTETQKDKQVVPVPAADTSAKVEAIVTEPAKAETFDKGTAAFVRQRKEIRELKKQIASAKQTPTPAPEQPIPAKEEPKAQAPAAVSPGIAPKPEAEVDESAAIQSVANDADVRKVPGAIMDIMDMVDSDSKLARLYEIDKPLALREATAMWKSKLGISAPPITPAPTHISGGMGVSHDDLTSLFKQLDSAKPGTKTYRDLVAKVNAAKNKQ